MTLKRWAIALLLAATLPGCAALSSISGASRVLPTYELLPAPPPAQTPARLDRSLIVSPPTASAALDIDRVLIKPSALQVEYLPDARWVDALPTHFQNLLVRSISNTGGVAFVTSDVTAPLPDFVVMAEVLDFQAELAPEPAPPAQVRVRVKLTLVRDADRRILATRTFEAVQTAATTDTATLILAFDTATRAVLAEAALWTVNAAAGRTS